MFAIIIFMRYWVLESFYDHHPPNQRKNVLRHQYQFLITLKTRLLAPKTRSSLKIIHHEYHLIIPNICIIIKSQVLLLCVEGEKVFDDDDDEVYQQL